MGEESLFKWSWSHYQDGHHPHIWWRYFKHMLQNQKVNNLGTWDVAFAGLPQALEIMENLENHEKSSMHGKIMEFEKT